MMTPLMGNSIEQIAPLACWAADNGCFAQPHRFRLDEYLAWLVRFKPIADRCLFATAPDVVGNAAETWERSRFVLPVLREVGYRAAFIGQDGMEHTRFEWDAFDCLFIGGSNQWKLSEPCCTLMAEAKRRGKWVHVGRVNSRQRLMTSKHAGADSCDGTYLAFGPDVNLPKLLRWLTEARQQMTLGEVS